MKKFEYTCVNVRGDMEEILNSYGTRGWELVFVVPPIGVIGCTSRYYQIFFKRELEPKKE